MKKIIATLLILGSFCMNTKAQTTGLKSYSKISDGTGGLPSGSLDNSDYFGQSLEGIGDLNGDGIEDMAVGAFYDDDGATNAGALWILFLDLDGSVKSTQKISNTSGGLGNIIGYDTHFGTSVTNIGDLDSDGVNDLAVGAEHDNDGGTDRGAVYILFMNSDGTVKDNQKISHTKGSLGSVLDNYDYFGESVCSLGDLDGDGLSEIVVGAYGDDDGNNFSGALWVLFLDDDGTVKDKQKISNTSGNFGGTFAANDYVGYGVSTIEDLDGDGINDIAVGARGEDDGSRDAGGVWILFLNADGTVKDEQKISATDGGFTGTLDGADMFGWGTEYAGDIDGDGYANLLVGALFDDDGGTNRGAVWNLNLGTDGTVQSSQKISSTEGDFTTLDNSDYFGLSIARVGDLDNDGIVEFVSSARNDDDGGTDRGAVYLMTFNGPNTLTALVNNRTKISDGTGGLPSGSLDNSDYFGQSLEGIGDLDGDGIEDMAVGAFYDDDGATNAGALWILFLNPDGSVKSTQKISNTSGGLGNIIAYDTHFGTSVTNIGDIDADGVNDLAVGADHDNDGGTDKGAIYILFMNSDGTVKDNQKISHTQGGLGSVLDNYDYFGESVCSVGDMDGDGLSEIVVGTYGDDDGSLNSGALWVLFLDDDGTVKDKQKISNTSGSFGGTFGFNDYIGYGVSSIGDLDGDGITDVAVGARGEDDGYGDAGGVWILFLNADGTVKDEQKISATAGGFTGALNAADMFGWATEYAGDIDGDGYANLLVGAINDDDGGTNRGAVWNLNLATDGTVQSYHKISSTQGGFTTLDNSDYFGLSIARIGDLNNDGIEEFASSPRNDDDGGTDRGAVYIMGINSISTSLEELKAAHATGEDLNLNWTYGESYDEDGTIISQSKQYVDGLGRKTQAMSKNFEKNKVLVAQTIYDKYGRPVVNTMAAPIGKQMVYKDKFATNAAGSNYNYNDFDVTTTLNSPNAIGNNQTNTLGRFYSDNSEELYQSTTEYPYSRVEYMADPTGRVKRNTAPGESHNMGSEHESKLFYMYAGGELDTVFGVDSSFYVTTDSTDRLQSNPISNTLIKAKKTIANDPQDEDKYVISYASDGLAIASCISGNTTTLSQYTTSTMLYDGTKSIDIHLPKSKSTTLKIPLPVYEYQSSSYDVPVADVIFKIIDLDSNKLLVETTDYTINAGTRMVTFLGTNKHRFLRLSFSYVDSRESYFSDNSITPPDANLNYTLDYSHWSVNYYDLAGKLRMNVSQRGFDTLGGGDHTEISRYDYDQYGQLLAQQTPDEGLTEYLYSDEGLVRFSQNEKQRSDEFSYVRYDEYNRAIESGEYQSIGGVYVFENYYGTSTGSNVLSILDDVDYDFNNSYCTDQTYTAYDELASADLLATQASSYTYKTDYEQHNLKGQVSKTWNEYNRTWYSYDYAGRAEYIVQQLVDADFSSTDDSTVKTFDYTYTPVTALLLKEEYQKNFTDEKLVHEYTYNKNQQLKTVTVKEDTTTVAEAAFDYYINGQLKRKELGDQLQGIDYVYTLHGQLKTINHPSLDKNTEPGQDGVTNGFKEDVFGMSLDYFKDDYQRTGTNIINSIATEADGYYNGLTKAVRWKVKDKSYVVRGMPQADLDLYTQGDTDSELMYQYTYDDFNRLETAKFGVFDNDLSNDNTTPVFTADASNMFGVYGTSSNTGIDYDLIGNITSLKRNGYTGTQGLEMDNLQYTYATGTSMLDSINDVATSTYSNDFETSGIDAFTYNTMGQMTKSDADGVHEITYYSNGQVKKVTFDNASGDYAEYFYNERGVKFKSNFVDVSSSTTTSTWYITDAGGGIRSLHTKATGENMELNTQMVYASGRLGVLDKTVSKVKYELSDHLGNVRASIWKDGAGDLEILSWADYYPFGEVLAGRNFNQNNDAGGAGYQGQEKVVNSKWVNFQLRMYNPSLGRFNTIDPYRQDYSPYQAMGNNPISNIDPDGGRYRPFTYNELQQMRNKLIGQLNNGVFKDNMLNFLLKYRALFYYEPVDYKGINYEKEMEHFMTFGTLSGRALAVLSQNDEDSNKSTSLHAKEGAGGMEYMIDGMSVSASVFGNFVDNTLRSSVTDVSSSTISFTTNGIGGSLIDDSQNMFGAGETNRNRRNRLAKEAAEKYEKSGGQAFRIAKKKFKKLGNKGEGTVFYYGIQKNSRGDFIKHNLIYDPTTNFIYEVQHPGDGDFDYKIEGGTDKSWRYAWDMDDEETAMAFWNFHSEDGGMGRYKISFSPVYVTDPAAVLNHFTNITDESRAYNYNLLKNNCKNYVIDGIRAGGGYVPTFSPLPGVWGFGSSFVWKYPYK